VVPDCCLVPDCSAAAGVIAMARTAAIATLRIMVLHLDLVDIALERKNPDRSFVPTGSH
jgi:hypothetical protein